MKVVLKLEGLHPPIEELVELEPKLNLTMELELEPKLNLTMELELELELELTMELELELKLMMELMLDFLTMHYKLQ
jgi:hypothetical protein